MIFSVTGRRFTRLSYARMFLCSYILPLRCRYRLAVRCRVITASPLLLVLTKIYLTDECEYREYILSNFFEKNNLVVRLKKVAPIIPCGLIGAGGEQQLTSYFRCRRTLMYIQRLTFDGSPQLFDLAAIQFSANA